MAIEVFRVVQSMKRAGDLSGTGAFRYGGRWNSKGVYMLYTSATSSLALLETLVHFDPVVMPPDLYMMRLLIDEAAPIYTLPDEDYPATWKKPESQQNKTMGEVWMKEKRYLAIKVKSVVNELDFNYLLNPVFPGYQHLIMNIEVTKVPLDPRLYDK